MDYFRLITAMVAGVVLGPKVFEKVDDGLRTTYWKHFQRGLIVVAVGFGFGGLAALADRVDSQLLLWVSFVGIMASITYGSLHQHAALRGKTGN